MVFFWIAKCCQGPWLFLLPSLALKTLMEWGASPLSPSSTHDLLSGPKLCHQLPSCLAWGLPNL